MKFTFNETVVYNDEVGIIQDSRIINDVLQYLVYLEDGTKIWMKEDVLMRYTANNVGKIGDKVTYYTTGFPPKGVSGFEQGIIVDVDYSNGFRYLIETMDRERYWKNGSEVDVCKS